ncbi:beta-galactosidase [Paenibacillus montanisoli]|uniref:Glycosyl hydrolase n=1 Tax=Paenibacillus montanisoli TaxID=2081970 RepID=A0A328U475_9BACL|nr:beta-galactosidase [Paenibacillus montanisoli]RAP77608.1 glycosyl hydrolase [Paenibacillus montanisoli]
MIEIINKQIVIDGTPQLIMCGEVHYYRLQKHEWQDRIDKLKDAGCNAVASYVPWLCHEPEEGQFDLDGRTRPELDLAGFIDLCQANGLYFFVRPGPFIMAEMKNEGIPFWVYEKYPEVIPYGWDGAQATTRTLDYMAPNFLAAARNWYAAVMAVIAPRLHGKGGSIIGVQLDNEIGMLSWVSNCPDLTEHVVADFAAWLGRTYGEAELKQRYPFSLEEGAERLKAIRSPEESYSAELLHDLGYYMRNRFARYVAALREYAEEFGVTGVPFIVNIHGTGGGRGFTFPIGISQLYESYTQGPGYLSGSDIYFGDLTMSNFQDLYLINGFMDAVHLPDQPLTSLEFECGDGNYGNNYGGRYDVSAADFKTRMCIAQGNRMINYYLMTGGINYRMDQKIGDGNDRVAFTGERHGFAAPVSPEGELNYTYPRMQRAIKTMMAVKDKLAVMNEERDGVAFAFIPDYYMTEYRYPKSGRTKEIVQNIEANRAYGGWEIMARGMLLAGYRFGSVDIQNKPLDPSATPVLALPCARYLSAAIQRKLADYLNAGGGLLLYGEVPQFDMEGKPCTILSDALGIQVEGFIHNGPHSWPSIMTEGWAAGRPEVHTGFAQRLAPGDGEVFMRLYDSGAVCGVEAKAGRGRAIVIAASYSGDVPLFKTALERLGVEAGLTHDNRHYGIFTTSTANAEGERFLHVLNLDGFEKELSLSERGTKLFGGRKLAVGSKDGYMLPLGVSFGDVRISYATAEINAVSSDAISFRLTQPEDVIAVETERGIAPSEDYIVDEQDGIKLVVSRKHAKIDDKLTLKFV